MIGYLDRPERDDRHRLAEAHIIGQEHATQIPRTLQQHPVDREGLVGKEANSKPADEKYVMSFVMPRVNLEELTIGLLFRRLELT